MTNSTFQTKLRRDGYIHVPKRVQAALGLNAGDAVFVTLIVPDDDDLPTTADNQSAVQSDEPLPHNEAIPNR